MEVANLSQASYGPFIWAMFPFNILKKNIQWEVSILLE
jgi:hypothetical protein